MREDLIYPLSGTNITGALCMPVPTGKTCKAGPSQKLPNDVPSASRSFREGQVRKRLRGRPCGKVWQGRGRGALGRTMTQRRGRRASGTPRGESPLPPAKQGCRGLNEAPATVAALGAQPRSRPGLPAALGLRCPVVVVRDHLRPQGPALPQPVSLGHGSEAPVSSPR